MSPNIQRPCNFIKGTLSARILCSPSALCSLHGLHALRQKGMPDLYNVRHIDRAVCVNSGVLIVSKCKPISYVTGILEPIVLFI